MLSGLFIFLATLERKKMSLHQIKKSELRTTIVLRVVLGALYSILST